MIEFLRTYGIWIALGLLLLLMVRRRGQGHGCGMGGCGMGGSHDPSSDSKDVPEEKGTDKTTGSSCH